MSNNAPFPIQPHLTAISLAYRNKAMIADMVLPRVPVSKQEFKYNKQVMAEGFTIPDTKVGRTSQPNKVEFKSTETAASTVDYGLEDPIPQADIDNAPTGSNPVGRSTEMLTNLVGLDREKRTADAVFNAANYGTNFKVTLAGADQFSDFIGSDPLATIMDCLDAMIMRGNIMVLGQQVFGKLARHPKVVKAVLGNSGDSGIATLKAIADLFLLEAVYVGQAWLNSSKKGQTASLSQAWGKCVALLYRDQVADASRGTTFGFTAEFGSRIAGATPDKNIGLRGGQMVRVGESVKEIIAANDLGYLISAAVA